MTRKTTLFFLLLTFGIYSATAAKSFTVVIDPGHGGKDPGAVGTTLREKDVNLSVSLLVGELIRKNHTDVSVIYTRIVDKDVPLINRPVIANKANADIFISIHANAAGTKAAYGTEVYTIGIDKSNANLEVAKRENSVILLEDNYVETYEGFNPTSPDSYIMFEFMQSHFTEQSLRLASHVRQAFVAANRYDRGVRQDNFWVLHQTKMPSILIELGFVTNPTEEKYMLSQKGKNELAQAIYKGFAAYKHDYDLRFKNTSASADATGSVSGTTQKTSLTEQQKQNDKQFEKMVETTTREAQQKGILFKVQLFASSTLLSPNDVRFKDVKCDVFQENGMYKYTYGQTSNFKEIEAIKLNIREKFEDAFIIAFKNNKKISVVEALKEISAK
ncbi:MAG: N-acetylmuramoyl-L-alanine amidase [Prevotellaceae bacterium]|nr:N-acetylmuramoyl-L-alanine amidase [Prevotellaceae bacterium]